MLFYSKTARSNFEHRKANLESLEFHFLEILFVKTWNESCKQLFRFSSHIFLPHPSGSLAYHSGNRATICNKFRRLECDETT